MVKEVQAVKQQKKPWIKKYFIALSLLLFLASLNTSLVGQTVMQEKEAGEENIDAIKIIRIYQIFFSFRALHYVFTVQPVACTYLPACRHARL